MTPRSALAWTIGAAATLRREAYRHGLLQRRAAGVPVVSVGSLAMGGSGKTPVARLLVDRLRQRLPVAVVCGGYGGTARRPAVVDPDHPRSAEWFGDEAVLMARWISPLPVVAGRDKLAAARIAAERGARLVVVDDGFQHQRLARDLDIVVYHRDPAPAVVPLGDGREPRGALACADLLWLHLRDGGWIAEPASADVVSRVRPHGLLRADGTVLPPSRLEGTRVCLLAGIAHPDAFRRLVERAGARVTGQVFVRDHRRFDRRHLRRAAATAPDLILCTEKDLVRMGNSREAGHLTALACRTEVARGAERLDRALDAVLEGTR